MLFLSKTLSSYAIRAAILHSHNVFCLDPLMFCIPTIINCTLSNTIGYYWIDTHTHQFVDIRYVHIYPLRFLMDLLACTHCLAPIETVY